MDQLLKKKHFHALIKIKIELWYTGGQIILCTLLLKEDITHKRDQKPASF